MLFFISVSGLSAHIHDILVMHRYQMIQQDFAGLQQKANHHCITLVIGKPLEVGGTISFGLLEEIIKKRGG